MIDRPIADSNIKGLRWRDLITIVVCTATIVASVLGVMSSLKSEIRTIKSNNVSDSRLIELRLSTAEATLRALQTQIDGLRTDIYINRRNIENK